MKADRMKLVEDGVQRLAPTVSINHEPLEAVAHDELPPSQQVQATPALEVIGPNGPRLN